MFHNNVHEPSCQVTSKLDQLGDTRVRHIDLTPSFSLKFKQLNQQAKQAKGF